MKAHLTTAVGIGIVLAIGALARAADAPAAQPASASQAPVVAKIGEISITMDQVEKPLLEGYGLNILLNVIQREIAKDTAARRGVKVTPEDIQQERDQTIERMFKDSNEKMQDKIAAARLKGQNEEAAKLADQMRKDTAQAFDQLLQEKHLSMAEFDIVNETNAYLRKIAEPMLAGKITDDALQEAFKALYGEKVKCRHIQCANLAEIQQAKDRLAAGEPFAKVAQEMSRNSGTGPLGGELPPFSLQFQNLPQAFKDAAFALKVGQVSEIVQAEGAYHLILLEGRIPPKAVKFEDVKESLRADLMDKATQATVKQLRQQLADQAIAGLSITDPVMKAQWADKLAKRDAAIKSREGMRDQMRIEREKATTQSATQPAFDWTAPPPAPTTAPAVPK